MTTTFFISDTHFGHDLVRTAYPQFRPGSTIEEHDEILIQRWNEVVKPTDIVWHLGDFALKTYTKRMESIARRLNGDKRIVLGNHDNFKKMDYTKFFTCYGAHTIGHDFILTHIPVQEKQFGRFKVNIHGHLHAAVLEDPRYWNVSCEQIDCRPIAFEELKKRHSFGT